MSQRSTAGHMEVPSVFTMPEQHAATQRKDTKCCQP